ncbi:hypothetical protein EJ04DRAFT_575027 [Polyplosphaeria fusca]|uniref:Uncharacterized protein n=1 Tax=Polyplosphaeria fusca TaxID=682080 RepID=A0A9P4R296_9PLEO|nr:hypothetical protein EJ04DRAFT_575027 [Polyplosphaeria fusca]
MVGRPSVDTPGHSFLDFIPHCRPSNIAPGSATVNMMDSLSVSTIVLLGAASALLLAAMLYPGPLLRWLQLKRYQYEVTFALYMLTATEKFIFNSLLFLLVSLLIIAVALYLPEHVVLISNRIFYYFLGDEASLSRTAKSTTSLISAAATQFLGSRNAVTNMGAAAQNGALAGPGRGLMEA